MAIDFKVTTLTYFSNHPVRLLVCQIMYLKCVVTVVNIKLHVVTVVSIKLHVVTVVSIKLHVVTVLSIKLHVVTVVSIKLHVVTVLSIKLHVFQKGVIYKHLLTACLDIG
jgi:hypothetical protein